MVRFSLKRRGLSSVSRLWAGFALRVSPIVVVAGGTSRSGSKVAFFVAIAAVHTGVNFIQTDACHRAVFEVFGSPVLMARITHRRKSREFAFGLMAMLAFQGLVIMNEGPSGVLVSEGLHFFRPMAPFAVLHRVALIAPVMELICWPHIFVGWIALVMAIATGLVPVTFIAIEPEHFNVVIVEEGDDCVSLNTRFPSDFLRPCGRAIKNRALTGRSFVLHHMANLAFGVGSPQRVTPHAAPMIGAL